MFLLALIAFLLLASGIVASVVATGDKAAVRAADREGMPAQSQTNHPAHTGEARVTSDASSRPARSGTCPAAESDDLGTCNTILPTHGLPSSASPDLIRGLGLGLAMDRAGQLCLILTRKAHGPDLSSCTASPRPRLRAGEAAGVGVDCTKHTALL